MGFAKIKNMGKYLGAEIIQGRVNRCTFKYTVEKMKSKLTGWKAKKLSLAGRVTLANSVLQAMPLYLMMSVKFSVLTCNEIDKVIPNFF